MSHPWAHRFPLAGYKPPRVHAKNGVVGATSLDGPLGSCTFIHVGAHVEVAKGSPGWLREQIDKLLEKHDAIFLPSSFTQYAALFGLWVQWPRDGERFEVKSNSPVKVDRRVELTGLDTKAEPDEPERTLEKDLKMLYGLPPYNTPGNYCYADGYFANDIEDHWGKPPEELAKGIGLDTTVKT